MLGYMFWSKMFILKKITNAQKSDKNDKEIVTNLTTYKFETIHFIIAIKKIMHFKLMLNFQENVFLVSLNPINIEV